MKKILPPALVWLCICLMALLRWLWPVRVILPAPYHLFGLAVLAIGCALMLAAWNQFRVIGANINTFGRPGESVAAGLYSYSRNPMYLGFALMLGGMWLLLGALTPLLGVLLFVGVTDRWYIAYEEKEMQTRFGQAYAAYCRRTRRWF